MDEKVNLTKKSEKEIDLLIRSRYPIIYVVSYEESRVIEFLKRLCLKGVKECFIWSCIRGVHRVEQRMKVDETTRDIMNALNYIEQYPSAAVFVMLDIHQYITDPSVMRRLRDLVNFLKGTYKNIIILSPVLSIPIELEKDIVVVDYELPDRDELGELLDSIICSLTSNCKIVVNLKAEDREKILSAALGLTFNEAENAFARAIAMDGKLDGDDVKKILEEKKQIIRKSGILEYYNSTEFVEDIGGLDYLKDWLRKRSVAFTTKAKEFGLPQPKGILLIGVQGCGKSLTAKAIANLWQMPLLRFDVGKVFSGIVGSSEENMRRAIKVAESVSPVILWIDEIEKAFSGVQNGNLDAGTSARVFGTFLTWLQEKTKPVFVVATANNISVLPPELLRKGRFDEIFFVDLPNDFERKEIFKIHIRKRQRNIENFDIEYLSKISEGFNGSEIEQAVISGLFDAFVENRDLSTKDIERSIKCTVPLSATMRESLSSLREWARTRARKANIELGQVEEKIRKIEL